MSAFATVYRPPPQHQSFLTREHKHERKRKRDGRSSDDNEGDDSFELDQHNGVLDLEVQDEADRVAAPRVSHPVSKTDPFYVAGLSRQDPLPGGEFPHAPLPGIKDRLVIEEELARLKPPIFTVDAVPDNQDSSLKRRHLDNLTTILHKCMLNGDWERASRAWGLILRTEIQGRGIDVRYNGRWLVGGEILLRRAGRCTTTDSSSADRPEDSRRNGSTIAPTIAAEGFRLAREYYERLILQYPHMPRQSAATVNALAIYPALFNVWIFEVQDRAARARRCLRRSSMSNSSENGSTSRGDDTIDDPAFSRIATLELEQAMPIAQRMDNIMLNPPYDKSEELLHLRSMVSLWLCQTCKSLSFGEQESSFEEDVSSPDLQKTPIVQQRRSIMSKERGAATRTMKSMVSMKMDVPPQLRSFVEDEEQYDEREE